jgi:cystathionine beta-lyase/cystathionine gamma-synthase
MILARDPEAAHLSRYREHLGTNVTDASVHMLPRPDRRSLDARLDRLDRNAGIVAERLAARVERGDGIVSDVVHPSLRRHHSARVTRSARFHGSFLALGFEPGHDRDEVHRAFLRAALAEARAAGVALVAGASFGLDVTRVYVTGPGSGGARPFVRVAVGTEHRLGIEEVAEALGRAIDVVSERAAGPAPARCRR